jgi:hypothetical protein
MSGAQETENSAKTFAVNTRKKRAQSTAKRSLVGLFALQALF